MSTWKTEAMALLDNSNDFPNQQRFEAEDGALLERLLLLAFMVVATASVGWHLATGIHWMWTNCANHLHIAVQQVGRPF